MIKEYEISKRKRIGGETGHYFVWLLFEYGLEDKVIQYAKVIADFGNTKKEGSYQYAKKLKELLEKESAT